MRELLVSIILAASVTAAACGKGGARIVKTSVVDRPRISQGVMAPQNVLLVDVECAANTPFEGRLDTGAPANNPTETFKATTDGEGHGQGALELTGYQFAKVKQVEIRCDGMTARAPVSLPLTLLFNGNRALCWGTSCEVGMTTSRGFAVFKGVGPDLDGFTFAGQSAVADGTDKILRTEPPGGTAKLRLDQLNTSIRMGGVLAITSHGKTAEVTIPETAFNVYTEPLARSYLLQIEANLVGAKRAVAPPTRSSAVLHLGDHLYPIGDMTTLLGSVEVLAVATEIRTGSKIRTINCGTYRGAGGVTSSYVVYLIDSDVTVYDVPTKTILGTKTFRGSGSCPSSFLSENGQEGKSGGYAKPDQIEAYVSTFVK